VREEAIGKATKRNVEEYVGKYGGIAAWLYRDGIKILLGGAIFLVWVLK
jgi:hypothetical protein